MYFHLFLYIQYLLYIENDQRINLRDKIFREAISNLLIHREFINPFPAKLIIESDRVYIENSNKPHGNGIIDPERFSPYPKNPTIAKFFKEIGWVDELGSGVKNIYKYNKIYSGASPEFIEGDIFKTIIPLTPQDAPQDKPQDTPQDDVRVSEILEFSKSPRSRQEMQDLIGMKDVNHFRKKFLKPLLEAGFLKMTLPDKPTSKNQRYYSCRGE